MSRRSLASDCCHCGTKMRLIYRCHSSQQEEPFRLRVACPACQTNLVILSGGEVYYDESRLEMGYCKADLVLSSSEKPNEIHNDSEPSSVVSIFRRQQRRLAQEI